MIMSSALYIFSFITLMLITNAARLALSGLWYLIFKSSSGGWGVYALIYFPGTLLHEISHFLFAAFLGVRTGNITLFPKTDHEKNRVQLGSVQIAKTDFVRSSLIGAAPFITGTVLLIYLCRTMGFLTISSIADVLVIIRNYASIDYFWLKMYAILAISNTLFTSKEDRQHWPVFIVMTAIIVLLFYITGITIPFAHQISAGLQSILMGSTVAFGLSAFVNGVLFVIFKTAVGIVEWFTKTKVTYA
ncbi:hypothetical protein A3B57_03685 [Microgenomates group bacterium RIFCSPLOWO2_01_FULL_47_10]|nr:MAG: hypothetical protein A3B57_03685 [Microgenomates group bacterium RIFCSPLOWO2_01_FULL_47_10]